MNPSNPQNPSSPSNPPNPLNPSNPQSPPSPSHLIRRQCPHLPSPRFKDSPLNFLALIILQPETECYKKLHFSRGSGGLNTGVASMLMQGGRKSDIVDFLY